MPRHSSKSTKSLQSIVAVILYNAHRFQHNVDMLGLQCVNRESPSAGAGCVPCSHHIVAAVQKRVRVQWRPEDVQVLQSHLASLPPGSKLQARKAMEKLGLAGLPEHSRLYEVVYAKLHRLRSMQAHGQLPPTGAHRLRAHIAHYQLRAWLGKSFLALPNRTGTLADAAAILEADPEVGPKLDMTPDPQYRHRPKWRADMCHIAIQYPEFVKTGEKRDRFGVYRFDEAAQSQPKRRKRA